jgi:hypothetical protein
MSASCKLLQITIKLLQHSVHSTLELLQYNLCETFIRIYLLGLVRFRWIAGSNIESNIRHMRFQKLRTEAKLMPSADREVLALVSQALKHQPCRHRNDTSKDELTSAH